MYLKYYHSDSCMSVTWTKFLKLYTSGLGSDQMCSPSHVRIVSSGMSISQKRKKRERSRENGRRDPGEDQALLSSWGNWHHCTMHYAPCTIAPCITGQLTPCTTGATGTAGNLPVGNLEQVGWDNHCQCALPRTSHFILIIS